MPVMGSWNDNFVSSMVLMFIDITILLLNTMLKSIDNTHCIKCPV